MDPNVIHKHIGKRTRRDSGRLSPAPGSRKNSRSTPRTSTVTRISQATIPFPIIADPEPSSLSSEGSIPQWRREEIRALPQELLAQCLLTMQARERQALEIRTQSLLTSPDEKATAARSVGGLDDTVGGFAKQERVRQMQTLMVMWSRGKTPL